MNQHHAYLISVITGIFIGMQPVINARLGSFATPLTAAMQSITISFSLILLIGTARGELALWPELLKSANPFYLITGGLMGASIVFLSLLAVPVIGANNAVTVFIVFQLLAAVLLDHFGLFGNPVHLLTPARAVGIALLLAGAFLVIKN